MPRPLILKTATQLSPSNSLPQFADPPRRLNLNLNLKPAPKTPLNLAPAPAAAAPSSAAAAFSSAPLATTVLLAAGFTLGLAIGDAIYQAVSDDPSLSDYLNQWLSNLGGQSQPQPSGGVDIVGPPPFQSGQVEGAQYQYYGVATVNGFQQTTGITILFGKVTQTRVDYYAPGQLGPGAPQQWRAVAVHSAPNATVATTFFTSSSQPITDFSIVYVSGPYGGDPPGPVLSQSNYSNGPTISPSSPVSASSPSSYQPQKSPFPIPASAVNPSSLVTSPLPVLGRAPAPSPTNTVPNVQTKTTPDPIQNNGKPPTATPNACLCSPTVNAVDKLVNPAPTANNAGIANLLGLGGLAALVQQIANVIGLDAFPLDVPATINQCDIRPGKQLNNLAESQLWQVEQLDSVMGQWCNSIDIDTPEGRKNFEVKDMSDAVSEILGMLAAQSINSGITQNAVIRNLIETGATKQQSFLAHQYAKGNAEFLGYEGQRQKTNMPLTFTPGKDLLEGLLGHGNIPVQGWKNTSSRDLGDVLNELLQAAAIIRAVYWRRLNPNGDMEGQVKDIIGRQANFADQVRQDEENNPDGDDWLQYIEAVENAFGIDQANPYGRDVSQRPRIVNKQPPDGLQ